MKHLYLSYSGKKEVLSRRGGAAGKRVVVRESARTFIDRSSQALLNANSGTPGNPYNLPEPLSPDFRKETWTLLP